MKTIPNYGFDSRGLIFKIKKKKKRKRKKEQTKTKQNKTKAKTIKVGTFFGKKSLNMGTFYFWKNYP